MSKLLRLIQHELVMSTLERNKAMTGTVELIHSTISNKWFWKATGDKIFSVSGYYESEQDAWDAMILQQVVWEGISYA
jgi:hypothetical protein